MNQESNISSGCKNIHAYDNQNFQTLQSIKSRPELKLNAFLYHRPQKWYYKPCPLPFKTKAAVAVHHEIEA
jgi:hypothetical protein